MPRPVKLASPPANTLLHDFVLIWSLSIGALCRQSLLLPGHRHHLHLGRPPTSPLLLFLHRQRQNPLIHGVRGSHSRPSQYYLPPLRQIASIRSVNSTPAPSLSHPLHRLPSPVEMVLSSLFSTRQKLPRTADLLQQDRAAAIRPPTKMLS